MVWDPRPECSNRSPCREASLDASRLEKAFGELALAVKAIQRIAVEKGLCTPDELQRKMLEIDREDGDRGRARADAVSRP
jgi:hypothetical protein